MTPLVSFFVSGKPRSAQVGNIVRLKTGRVFKLTKQTPWFALCRLIGEQFRPPDGPTPSPVVLRLLFYYRIPKSIKRKYPTIRPDGDNLLKGLADCWNGVLWGDDQQIVDYVVSKRYGPEEGVLVQVYELGSDDWPGRFFDETPRQHTGRVNP